MNISKAILLVVLSGLSFSTFASQCIVGTVKEVGTWVNTNSKTDSITKAIFKEECRNDSAGSCNGDICTITSGVKLVYTAELWGKCSPTDCVWRKVDGTYTSKKGLKFNYDSGFAKRVISAKVTAANVNRLDLVVDTNFVDPNRPDYQSRDLMKRK